jgi:hypothetical protein
MSAPKRQDERLADWVDGRLSPRHLERFEAEMRVDPELRAEAERYRRTVESLRSAFDDTVEVDRSKGSLADRVLAEIEDERARAEEAARREAAAAAERRASSMRPWVWSSLAAALLVAAFLGAKLLSPGSEPQTHEDVAGASADDGPFEDGPFEGGAFEGEDGEGGFEGFVDHDADVTAGREPTQVPSELERPAADPSMRGRSEPDGSSDAFRMGAGRLDAAPSAEKGPGGAVHRLESDPGLMERLRDQTEQENRLEAPEPTQPAAPRSQGASPSTALGGGQRRGGGRGQPVAPGSETANAAIPQAVAPQGVAPQAVAPRAVAPDGAAAYSGTPESGAPDPLAPGSAEPGAGGPAAPVPAPDASARRARSQLPEVDSEAGLSGLESEDASRQWSASVTDSVFVLRFAAVDTESLDRGEPDEPDEPDESAEQSVQTPERVDESGSVSAETRSPRMRAFHALGADQADRGADTGDSAPNLTSLLGDVRARRWLSRVVEDAARPSVEALELVPARADALAEPRVLTTTLEDADEELQAEAGAGDPGPADAPGNERQRFYAFEPGDVAFWVSGPEDAVREIVRNALAAAIREDATVELRALGEFPAHDRGVTMRPRQARRGDPAAPEPESARRELAGGENAEPVDRAGGVAPSRDYLGVREVHDLLRARRSRMDSEIDGVWIVVRVESGARRR